MTDIELVAINSSINGTKNRGNDKFLYSSDNIPNKSKNTTTISELIGRYNDLVCRSVGEGWVFRRELTLVYNLLVKPGRHNLKYISSRINALEAYLR